jgi:hypothetical protein
MRKLTTEQARAREIISLAISDYRTKLEAITLTQDDLDPIMVEGETKTGYFCQLMVDPKDVAKILLEYDYPVFAVLEEEPPQGIWDDLADRFGLASVSSFDL